MSKFIANNTYESDLQKALVRDVAAGVYTTRSCYNPKRALLIALDNIGACERVTQHVEGLVFERPAAALTEDALKAALAAAQSAGLLEEGGDEVDVTIPDDFDTSEWYADQIIPDGNFLQAFVKDQQDRAQFDIDQGRVDSASIKPATTLVLEKVESRPASDENTDDAAQDE